MTVSGSDHDGRASAEQVRDVTAPAVKTDGEERAQPLTRLRMSRRWAPELRLITVASGVHRLHARASNWYVIEDRGRLTVLDSGLPRQWEAFCAALARLGYTPADIEAVLITHHHPDHAGNAERLQGLGARVLAHPADNAYLLGQKRLPRRGHARFLLHPWYARYMLHLLIGGVTAVTPLAHLEPVSDGQVLDVPGSPRVLHVPGHTAGSTALVLDRRSILFTGDALTTLDCTKGRTGPTIIRGPVTEDAGLALESLARLAATNARTVLPGHGEPWLDGVGTAVEIARRT